MSLVLSCQKEISTIFMSNFKKISWHNGKVERSHRNDQERFYNYLKFYSYHDLLKQMKAYLHRSNRIPMAVLGWKTPLQKRAELGG